MRVGQNSVATTRVEDFRLGLDVTPGERLSIAVESVSSEAEVGSALLELRMLSQSGARIALPHWPNRSSRVAEYQYLEVADDRDIALTLMDIDVPDRAVRLELVGHRWKAAVATAIIADPVINRSSDPRWVFETATGDRLQHSAALLDRTLQIPSGSSRVELRIDHVARGKSSSGPVAVTIFDHFGVEMLPLPGLQQHPLHGPIAVLRGEPDAYVTTLVEFDVPRGAASVRVRGIEWGDGTARVSGEVSLLGTGERGISVEDFVASIPPHDRLIVIDTTAPPMGHATLGLRPNNLSAAYARAGEWVIFLPFSSLQEFSHDVAERLFQLPRDEVDLLWSALRRHRRARADLYICSSFPSFEALAAANEAKRLGWSVTYEVRDDMEEFNRVGYSKWYSPLLEQQMLRVADRVISVSRALDEKMLTMHPQIAPHAVIPNGVRAETIAGGKPLRTRQAADHRAESRTVGYVGHLTSSWFDWPMLVRVAQHMPEIRFEIVGHGLPKDLELPPNVVHLGAKTHDELIEIVREWKVGLIPFRDIPLTRSVDPNKIYEYFAWGIRCVTVDMGAVTTYPWTRVYDDAASFESQLRCAMTTPVSDEDLAELERFLSTVDWDSRARQVLAFVEEGASR